jgi:hypothetical protein
MKTTHILLALLLLIGYSGCKKSSDPEPYFPAEPARVVVSLTKSFDTLNRDMSASAALLAQNITDTAATRAAMLGLFNRSSFVLEFSRVTPMGIMKIVEPSGYHYIQGSDISMQNHVVQCFQTRQPVLSKMFYAVEDFYGVVDIHPIVNQGALMGGITALFRPQTLLQRIIMPMVTSQPFEIWVMEKGGVVLFDQDTAEIGLNVLTDSLYKPFPELIAAAKLIDAGQSGETSYSFYKTGTTTRVVKKTYWTTYTLYGMEWKIIWVKPE